VTAIGDAEAVICAVGAGSAFDGKLFDEVDRKVWEAASAICASCAASHFHMLELTWAASVTAAHRKSGVGPRCGAVH